MREHQEIRVRAPSVATELRDAAADHLEAAYMLLRRSDRQFAAYLVQLALAAVREKDMRH
jgi:hypothetical protein